MTSGRPPGSQLSATAEISVTRRSASWNDVASEPAASTRCGAPAADTSERIVASAAAYSPEVTPESGCGRKVTSKPAAIKDETSWGPCVSRDE